MARRRIRRKAKPSWLRRIKQGLYTGVIGLGLFIGVSYLPAALADEYPAVQRTIEVAVEARQWAFQAMVDTGTLAGGEFRLLLELLPANITSAMGITRPTHWRRIGARAATPGDRSASAEIHTERRSIYPSLTRPSSAGSDSAVRNASQIRCS